MMSETVQAQTAPDPYAKARFNMVEGQIRPNRVSEGRLLAALAELPREVFVPGPLAGVAYVDQSVKVNADRYLLEPLFLARLLQEAAVKPGERVLAIGAATGYSAALLARLGASVVALESDSGLAAAARANLARVHATGVAVEVGPLEQGWAAGAPYDVILLDGAIAELPPAITAQLAENGRLVAIKSQEGRHGAGMLYRKLGGHVSGRALFDAVGPFLPGFEPRRVFTL